MVKQVSAVADEPARRAASRQTCCKQRWTFSVINLRPNSELHRVSEKRPTFTACYNFYIHSTIATIFGINVAEKVGNQNALYFSTTPN